MNRVLVAGVGNLFLSDDAFGVEVAKRLQTRELPAGVEVADFGIRGVHLAYQLLDGYDMLLLVDATRRGSPPGTLYVIEPNLDPVAQRTAAAAAGEQTLMDAHGMEPDAVLALLGTFGGSVGRVLVVGCEPATVEEGIGLSEPVARVVDAAADLVLEVLAEAFTEATSGKGG